MELTDLKPFDKVLVRNDDRGTWTPDIFRRFNDYELDRPFVCIGGRCYSQCILYEHNEKLMFTSNNYIADVEFKEDALPIDTPVMCARIDHEWKFGYYRGNDSVCTRKSDVTGESMIFYGNLKYIIPFKNFDSNNIEECIKKYNIVKE